MLRREDLLCGGAGEEDADVVPQIPLHERSGVALVLFVESLTMTMSRERLGTVFRCFSLSEIVAGSRSVSVYAHHVEVDCAGLRESPEALDFFLWRRIGQIEPHIICIALYSQ